MHNIRSSEGLPSPTVCAASMGKLSYYLSVISLAAVSTAVFVLCSMLRSEPLRSQMAMASLTEKQSVLTDDQHALMRVVTESSTRHGPPGTEPLTSSRIPIQIQNSNVTTNHLSNKTKVLLFWSMLYGTDPWVRKTRTIECYGSGFKCIRTSEKHFFEDSDVVVFHSRAANLRTSVRKASEKKRPPHQRWLLYADGESPVNTPDLSFLNGLINWTASYMRGADIVEGLMAEPGEYKWGGFDPNRNYLENKTAMAAILVSHCLSARMDWVKKLQRYISVDVYGACGTMKCGSDENCSATLRKYKFYLSFENSYCMDYITEKFYFKSLKNGVVPVIISWVDTSDTPPLTVPPGSFINALDYPTVQELANYMAKVGGSPTLYNEYFRWRSTYDVILDTFGRIFCEVCKKIHLDTESVKSHPDIGLWFSRERCCKPYPVPH